MAQARRELGAEKVATLEESFGLFLLALVLRLAKVDEVLQADRRRRSLREGSGGGDIEIAEVSSPVFAGA